MNNSLSNRVAIYARVSTQEQAEQGYSIEAQVKILNEYCRQTNKVLFNEYIDPGISGKEVENRPKLKQLLLDAKAGLFDEVVVWKINRLSRNLSDLMNLVDELNKHNVIFRSYSENFETETPMGRFALQMMGSVAELERNTIVENVKMGMGERAKNGRWNGGKVYSYRSKYNDEIKENRLEIEENEAVVVREIFNLFVNENCGYKKIAVALNNRGLKTMRNSSWSIQSIKQIIDNVVYKGFIRWGKYTDWSKNRREGKQEEYILVKGIHEPIISEDIWEKARKIREATGKISEKEYEGNYLLSGLMKCPVCGASMISHKTAKKGKIYRYYQCSNFFNKGSIICKSNLVNADKAELEVLRKINEIVKSKEIIEAIINRMERQSYVDITPLENQLKEIKKELKKLDDKKSEYLEQEFEGEIDVTTLDERLKHLASKKSKASDEFNYIQNEINNVNSQIKIEPKKVRAILENFELIFEKADIAKKKKLLKSVIESISVIQGESARDRKVGKVKLYFMAEDVGISESKKFANANGAVNLTINNVDFLE